MNPKLRTLIFIILFPLFASGHELSDPISLMRGMYALSKKLTGLSLLDKFCTNTTSCVCKTSPEGFFYQCDSLLYAFYESLSYELVINCKKNVREEDISIHIHQLSEVAAKSYISYNLILNDCPPGSISDLQYPNKIYSLSLRCAERKDFILSPDQFRNLSTLSYFDISCPSLRNIPEAIFKTNKRMVDISLKGTLIERLGKGLLSNLSRLNSLGFVRNEKLSVRKSDFTGLHNLKKLEITKSHIKEIEEDIFQSIHNLIHLVISDNELKRLPTSFTILQKLEKLEISNTSIEWIGNGTCMKQVNISRIRITSNSLLDIHPDCLQMYNNSEHIDLSGNRISSLPNKALQMNRLKFFKLNDNGCDIKSVENFIQSKTLLEIRMKNSSIQSIHKDFFRGIPNIKKVDLSINKITFLPDGFFELNDYLEIVSLRDNKLTSFPESLLDTKPFLTAIDVSHNDISKVDFKVRKILSSLRVFYISNNKLDRIPRDPFSNIPGITNFDISNNKISEIDTVALQTMSHVSALHILGNKMEGNFFPYHLNFEFLTQLDADSNSFTEINWLNMPFLVELNLSNNLIKRLNLTVFNSCENLKFLNLSRNKIESLPRQIFSKHLKNLVSLDLSFNRLKSLPDGIPIDGSPNNILGGTVFYDLDLDFLDVSGNQMERFELSWIRGTKKCRKVSIRSSNISALDSGSMLIVHAIVLDLSHNNINSTSWPWFYDEDLKLSGKISTFVNVKNLEELYLAYNEITDIGIDFRIHNPNLRILDLSYNKIKHLTYQELLFSSYRFLDPSFKKKRRITDKSYEFVASTEGFNEFGSIEPYHTCHSLKVDLRNNLIGSIEFPHAMLVRNVTSKCEKHKYSHATILLGYNPFECGCKVIPFLRVVEEDVVLTSELWRTKGINWVLQARIDATNLTCRYPESVNGKLVINTETWTHHILPLLGFCHLSED